MKQLWKKSPVLLSLVIALTISTTILAAFLFNYYYNTSIDAGSAPNVLMQAIDCTLTGRGQVDTCTYSQAGATIEVSDLDDDSVLTINQNFQNLDTDKTLSFLQTADTAISAQSCTEVGSSLSCDGLALTAGSYYEIDIVLEFENLQPSDSIVLSDLGISAEDN